MRINLRSAAAAGFAATLVAGLAVASAATANADSIGTLTGSPATGSTSGTFALVASSLCPTGTDLLNAYVNNTAAGWNDVLVVGANDTEIPNINTSGVQASNSLVAIAADQSPALTVSPGTYTVSLRCQAGFVDVLGTFDGSFTVTGTSYSFNAVSAPASSTTLAVNPSSPQNLNTPITLTATVTSTAPVAGTVQFKDGGSNLGSAVTVASGTASKTIDTLSGGSHSLTAEFIPTTPATVAGSTSSIVPFTISAPVVDTTTTLSSSPSAPTTADVVSLTATVAPDNAAGSVAFKEGATTVGTAPVSGGTASVSLTGLSAGTHSYTADFTPTDPASFKASSAAATSVTVTTFEGAKGTETITTKVDAGTLTITAGGPTVDLGSLALNAGNSLLTGPAKDINPVTVTDTRAGNLGWNVNGSVADFTNSAGDKINSENLGWTPKVVAKQSVQTVTAGSSVAPGAGVGTGASTGSGLKTSHLLGSAAAGSGIGTAQLGASLVLQAPTSTKPGQYNTTLTLTAI